MALENLRRKGFGRLLIGDQAVTLEDVEPAVLKKMTTLRVVVDRIKVSAERARASPIQWRPRTRKAAAPRGRCNCS